LKDHPQSVHKLLEKILEFGNMPTLVELAFENITDKINRTKLLLVKGKSMLKTGDVSAKYNQIIDTLDEAHKYLQNPDGTDDNNNVNLLLELYSHKISLAEKRRNFKDMKSFFDKVIPLTEMGMVSNAVLGTIYSCGGRARMRESKFADASSYFFEAVKNWDSCRRTQETEDCIKLKVVSSLLSGSKVNPFDDQVTASYLIKPTIKAYERITKDVLTKNADSFLQDVKQVQKEEIVKEYLPLLKRLIQKELFLEVVKPYTNISMGYVAKRIHSTQEETESILVELILNQQIDGSIDQATGTLVLANTSRSYADFYGGMNAVATAVERLQRNILVSLS
jgi:COP9 signalosome complex subunit 2